MTRALLLCTASLFATGCVSRTAPLFVSDDWSVEAWVDLGGEPAATEVAGALGWSQRPVALALDRQGRAIVAFEDGGVLATLGVRRWSGTHWEDLGSPGTGQGLVTLAVDAQDRPWVAWSGDDSPASVRVAMLDETTWQQLASISTGGAIPDAEWVLPTLAFDPQERAVIAFGTSGSGDFLCVHRYESGTWVLLAAPTTACFRSDSQRPGLAVNDAGSLMLAYVLDTQVWFSEWSSDAWSSQVVDPSTMLVDWWPAVTATVDGPVVAWVRTFATPLPNAVLLRQQVGSNWIERAGSATDSGLGTAATTAAVALATSPSGEPVVAWSDSATLRVRYWTGLAWSRNADVASVDGEGSFISIAPALATRGDRFCVAFTAGSDTVFDVYVRCTAGTW